MKKTQDGTEKKETKKYPFLYDALKEENYKKMCECFKDDILNGFDNQCRNYCFMSDEEVGSCGENLTRFQAAVFGEDGMLEEYLEEYLHQNSSSDCFHT